MEKEAGDGPSLKNSFIVFLTIKCKLQPLIRIGRLDFTLPEAIGDSVKLACITNL